MGRENESLYEWSKSHDQDGRHAHIWFKPLKSIVCACPYSSNIGLSAMTLYYPVQDKTTTQPVNTQNYYTKI